MTDPVHIDPKDAFPVIENPVSTAEEKAPTPPPPVRPPTPAPVDKEKAARDIVYNSSSSDELWEEVVTVE